MNLTKWKFLAKKFNKDNIPETDENNNVTLNFSLEPKQTYFIVENKVLPISLIGKLNY